MNFCKEFVTFFEDDNDILKNLGTFSLRFPALTTEPIFYISDILSNFMSDKGSHILTFGAKEFIVSLVTI